MGLRLASAVVRFCASLRPRSGVGSAPGQALPAGSGRAGLCGCVRICLSAYALGRSPARPGRWEQACPAQSLRPQDVFQIGCLRETSSAAARTRGGALLPTGLRGLRGLGQPRDRRQTPPAGGREGVVTHVSPQGEALMGRLRQMDVEMVLGKEAQEGRRMKGDSEKDSAGRTGSH